MILAFVISLTDNHTKSRKQWYLDDFLMNLKHTHTEASVWHYAICSFLSYESLMNTSYSVWTFSLFKLLFSQNNSFPNILHTGYQQQVMIRKLAQMQKIVGFQLVNKCFEWTHEPIACSEQSQGMPLFLHVLYQCFLQYCYMTHNSFGFILVFKS